MKPAVVGEPGSGEEPLELASNSYATACALLRDPASRTTVLGPGRLEFDEMNLRPTLDRKPLTPEMLSAARERCEILFQTTRSRSPLRLSRELLQDAATQIAHDSPFHPVREDLGLLDWDGSPRIAKLPAMFGAPDTSLNREMFRRFVIAAVARVMRPGCKVDNALVLVGKQGAGKSRGLAALFGPKFFSDSPMQIGERDAFLVLHSAWAHEWSELESYQRARSNNAVKAFLSSAEDTFRAPYDRTARRYPRSCVIVGSTNDNEFLTDPTGGRRYWVVPVGRVNVAEIEEHRDALWAEALAAWKAGDPWHLAEAEEGQLREAQREHEVSDPWESAVLGYAVGCKDGVTCAEVLDLLQIPKSLQTHAGLMRVGSVLMRAGYEKRRVSVGGERRWVYVRPAAPTPAQAAQP